MGCHSVFSKGYSNVWSDPDGSKLAEGRNLCETILEPLLDAHGPMSVAYGYISPELSKRIVSYQDPNAPSYHRWDKGAAADICVHSWVREKAPIFLAHEIDKALGYSRMITYSESPYICVATQINEGTMYRKAFYENRYCGKKGQKPLYIKKSSSSKARATEAEALSLEHAWQGAGYPTYHGGGFKQFQHRRVSRYSMLSDFLYSTHAIRGGVANVPDMTKYGEQFKRAGAVYDQLLTILDVPRLSIVRAFESFRFNDYPLFSWSDNFAIDFIPPEYMGASDVADAALTLSNQVVTVAVDNVKGVARVIGSKL